MSTDTSRQPAARNLLIGVTGGIAAYKVAALVSTLIQRGDDVVVAMTEAATRFIGETTFSSLTGRPVLIDPWNVDDGHASPHVHLAEWADAMLIAPCTMDMLSKLALGRTDDPVSLLAAAIDRSSTPVLLAPSMNAVMLSQPATRRNMTQLDQDGYILIEPSQGWQACRSEGQGRLPEPAELIAALDEA
ncbi:MAG: flavoprotein [Phycisphaerales bacterium]|nr:flavoprotein [Phycisphaerales bacterium]